MAGRKNVFIALSGGVDSSVAAALLVQQGFNCTAVFFITNDGCHQAEANAKGAATRLGIRLHVLDLRRDFEQILEYFCSEYKRGRTPNPCVFCNRLIKFGKLWDFARQHGADTLATGHYARVLSRDGKAGLYEAVNKDKDQSYALAMIRREVLVHIALPMGEYSKDEVRKMAAEMNLNTSDSAESQEICFIDGNNYAAVLEKRCPELVRKGKIVDMDGRVLGEHNGTHRFTIGQRRGLGVAMGKPWYVAGIDAQTNTVTLAPKEGIMHKKLLAKKVNWLIDRPTLPFRARVKIRYNDKGAPATVGPQGDEVLVEFDEPNPAITPGQLAVLYTRQESNSRVVGGAWIEEATD